MTAATATADTRALPPARNSAFAINVKILALFVVPALPAPTPQVSVRQKLATKPAQTRHTQPIRRRVRLGLRQSRGRGKGQLGAVPQRSPSLPVGHCDKLDSTQVLS